MMLNETYIHKLFAKYKKNAIYYFEKDRYDVCMQYLEAAAFTAYNFYIGFKDDDIEKLLKKLSLKLKCDSHKTILRNDVFVLYDSFSYDNGGLTQQYLDALIGTGRKIVYITERNNFSKKHSKILETLNSCQKSQIIELPVNLDRFAKAQYIYNEIIRVEASKLFIHIGPKSSSAVVAFYALPNEIEKYKINLTDHTFWIGSGCFDYSFEFRPYGAEISEVYRGVCKSKIFLLPFYPIMNKYSFLGYPKQADGKTVILSGGAYYKVYDNHDTFFKIAKSILDSCTNAIILFAGDGNREALCKKLSEYGLQDRFLLLGQRPDITEVFEHCDIYLNTFPFGGGLMCQYAAQLGKPIVNYSSTSSSKAEEFVCQRGSIEITSYSIDDLTQKVFDLINDNEYRKKYANDITSCVVTKALFNDTFNKILSEKRNYFHCSESHTMGSLNIIDKIKYENSEKWYQRIVTKIFGISALWRCPLFLMDSLEIALRENRFFNVVKAQFK